MGASQSREGDLDDSASSDGELASPAPTSSTLSGGSPSDFHSPADASSAFHSPSAVLDSQLAAMSLQEKQQTQGRLEVKLFHHIGGSTAKARWVVSEKLVPCEFVRQGEEEDGYLRWILVISDKVRAAVDERLQAKFFDAQLRVDFVFDGVWAIKLTSMDDYKAFVSEFQNCLFENTYMLKATEDNKIKVFGKDFISWAKPEEADESAWEDAEDTFEALPAQKELKEAFNESATGGIQSLTIGALEHSFLVSDSGIQAVKNMSSGIHGKGVSIYFGNNTAADSFSTPKKGLLLRAESNMMILSPAVDSLHSTGVHQLDIGTGKVVTEWRFEKDGTPITMKDVTNNSKHAQLDPSGSTFLGLDDNRLCRWDMRDRHGIVQDLVSPVLNWSEGHQFSRGTNFQCFATTGDGSIVVGSKDGKVRLYGISSMRMAKTAFPGLGSPITHVDVTYDGKWILATTDIYLILISTTFKDKDGKAKTGFSGRMGSNIAAPRLLKLTPLDAHLAGKDHKFRGGQFSWVTESGKQERHLVASVGNFSIIWNFRRVKESNHECYRNVTGLKSCYCYKIVPKEESIVDSKFMHDNYTSVSPEAPLVVATPKNVSSFNMWRE